MTDTPQIILDKIKQYDKIVISRHMRPDGDAIGSTKGLAEILKTSFPTKQILVINEDYSDYLAFLGTEDEQQSDEFYADALQIVIDTATTNRISNSKFSKAKELIKIDHHIDDKPFGDISWVQDEKSSSCEIIVDFYLMFQDELKLTKEAATYLYTGMVTDTGRFRFDGTNGNTMRCAGALLDTGVDMESLYAHLYLRTHEDMLLSNYVFKHTKFTKSGVAYFHISLLTQKRLGINFETASSAISALDSIKGSIIWLGFIENSDKTIRVRLRSRFVTVQELATHYHGGGHACASGATVYSKKEEKQLIADADKLSAEYKSTHDNWL